MYVGKHYTATAAAKHEIDFRCAHCGAELKATVFGVGKGSGHSPYFLNSRGAKEDARREAKEAAEAEARFIAELIPCPKCGRRDAGRMRIFWRNMALAVLGSAVIFAGLTALFAAYGATDENPGDIYFFPIVGVLAAIILSVLHLLHLVKAKQRVSLAVPEPVVKETLPKPRKRA